MVEWAGKGRVVVNTNLAGEDKKRPNNIPLFVALLGFLFLVIGLVGIAYFTSYSYTFSKFYDGDPKIRRWAVDTMVKKGDEVGERMLAVAKNSDEHPEVRRLAIFVLGEIKYKPALPSLIVMLKNAPIMLREQVAYALGQYARSELAFELISAYPTAPKGLKMKIIISLGNIGGSDSIELLKKEAVSGDALISKASEIALAKARTRMSI